MLLVDENGVKVGQIDTAEAVRMAEERMLDLVEVAPLACLLYTSDAADEL